MTLVLLLVAAAFVYACLLVAWTWHRLTRPPRRTAGIALAQGRPIDPSRLPDAHGTPRAFDAWTFTHHNLRLPVWDIPGDRPTGPVLIASHGWGDSRIGALSRAHALLPFVARFITWDAPGHGDAQGTCSLGTRETDLLIALVRDVAQQTEDSQDIVLFGWSMGAGVSLAASATLVRATPPLRVRVIAEAPYDVPIKPAQAVLAAQGLPTGWVLAATLDLIGRRAGVGPGFADGSTRASPLSPSSLRFARQHVARSLAEARVPVLVLHGSKDATCPPHDGEAITRAANGVFASITGCGHFGMWTNPQHATQATEAVRVWLESTGATGHEKAPPKSGA